MFFFFWGGRGGGVCGVLCEYIHGYYIEAREVNIGREVNIRSHFSNKYIHEYDNHTLNRRGTLCVPLTDIISSIIVHVLGWA